MDNALGILCVILVVVLFLYIVVQLVNINKCKNKIVLVFKQLDVLFLKRLNVLLKMLDLVKKYNRIEFEQFGSRLYDYYVEYNEYDINKKLHINEGLVYDLKKIMLVTKAYPELKEDMNYIKYEKRLIRYNKIINKYGKKYNEFVNNYDKCLDFFPSILVGTIVRFYKYDKFYIIDK